MGTRHPNPRLVKIHRSYTIDEAASRLRVHRNTVRAWIKRGLPTIDKTKPLLILGREVVAYLQARRTKSKQPCKVDELYCLRCRAPKKPAGGMVEYKAVTTTLGNLIAICPDCETIMNRRTTMAKLDVLRRHMDITMPKALGHIVDSPCPSLNCDLNDGVSDHGNA